MTKTIFGIEVNSKKELNTDLIKEEINYIKNDAINLLKTDFVTTDNVRFGNEMANSIFAEDDKAFNHL
jgi:hypothetical protein